MSDRKVWLLGLVSSLYESAMYSFVFMWTPVLVSAVQEAGVAGDLPFGVIFACFMVCIMVGSSLFSLALARGFTPASVLRAALVLALCSLALPLLTRNWHLLALAFLAFEVRPLLSRCLLTSL